MIFDFNNKFGHLQVEGFEKFTLTTSETSKRNQYIVPKKYRKSFIHSSNGFIQKYCKKH